MTDKFSEKAETLETEKPKCSAVESLTEVATKGNDGHVVGRGFQSFS